MNDKDRIVESRYIVPFMAVTTLFALWGFANDITNPMVAAFKTIMEISNAKASLVQFAFYGGYATMAIPAALFSQKYNYKNGILLGLLLYAVGALLFWPAAKYQSFEFFLISLYILTFGLAFLETTANPFILSIGSKNTATRRLNLAQSFNPLGSLLGMFVASRVVLVMLESDKRDNLGNLIYPTLDEASKSIIRANDLMMIRNPYVALGLVVLVMFLIILFLKLPNTGHANTFKPIESMKRLLSNINYRNGVVAQVFYVGAQIMCWTFIIQYAENIGINKATAQIYNIVAMCLFLMGRFISTYLMRYVDSRKLLMYFSIAGMVCITGVILIEGIVGLYCLIATSAFMSLMFPTIYGLSLENVGEDAPLGAAGLVMAIVGGALMPPLQGLIIDLEQIGFLPAVNASFILVFICFAVVTIYAYKTIVENRKEIKN